MGRGPVDRLTATEAPASSISSVSLPREASSDNPTGRPSTVASGTLICGSPACPAMHSKPRHRLRQASSACVLMPQGGAGPTVVGMANTAPSASRASTRWRMLARRVLAAAAAAGVIVVAHCKAFSDAGGKIRIEAAHPLAVRLPDLEALDDAEVSHPGVETLVAEAHRFDCGRALHRPARRRVQVRRRSRCLHARTRRPRR